MKKIEQFINLITELQFSEEKIDREMDISIITVRDFNALLSD